MKPTTFFDRHTVITPAHFTAAWVLVAQTILDTPIPTLCKLKASEREARMIGLRAVNTPDCRKAVAKLKGLPK